MPKRSSKRGINFENKDTVYEELKRLNQTGTVREYMKQFYIRKSRSHVEFPYLPESHYVTAFTSGLREDIKHLVLSISAAPYPVECISICPTHGSGFGLSI